jgi:uncharacterized protein (DUF2147 family)
MRLAVLSIVAMLAAASRGSEARAAVPAALAGWWLDGTGRAGIHFEPCGERGGQLCGTIRWLLHPLRDGLPEVDQLNADASLRHRRVCGLPLLGGFVAAGDGRWSGGWIYDPDDGETYRSTITLTADGTLRVRGYVGIPLLGRTETWTRPTAPLTPCT